MLPTFFSALTTMAEVRVLLSYTVYYSYVLVCSM